MSRKDPISAAGSNKWMPGLQGDVLKGARGGVGSACYAACRIAETGMLDFAAFAVKMELKKTTKVLIHKVEVFTEKEMLKIRVVGSHFLWHMVRRMVGIMADVGCHRLTE